MHSKIYLNFYIIIFLSFTLCIECRAANNRGYRWTTTQLDISAYTPPAILFVSDSLGNISGANQNFPFDKFGRQAVGPAGRNLLQNIPLSNVQETNDPINEGNDVDEPSSATIWNVSINDSGAQNYMINLLGVASAVEKVDIFLVYHNAAKLRGKNGSLLRSVIYVPVESGVTRQVELQYDPIQKIINPSLISNPNYLYSDTKLLCQLNEIKSGDACFLLENLAGSIKNSINHEELREAIFDLEIYLNILSKIHQGKLGDPGFDGLEKDKYFLSWKSQCEKLSENIGNYSASNSGYQILEGEALSILNDLKLKTSK